MKVTLLRLLIAMVPFAANADVSVSRGRAIFEGTADTALSVRVNQRLIPAHGISCAGCHGRDAGGGAEIQAGPAITWEVLAAAGYDAASFERALTDGTRPDGTDLGGAMPRFGLGRSDDAKALIAYLQVISDQQRSGLTENAIFLQRGTSVSAAPQFWQAFESRIQQLAPQGLFGRKITLTDAPPAFASLGSIKLPDQPEQPQLFPLVPLIGDEDPLDVRGAFATVAAQIKTAADHARGLRVFASAEIKARLAPLLNSSKIEFGTAQDTNNTDPAMVVGNLTLAQNSAAQANYIMADDLPYLQVLPECFYVTDSRPAPDINQPPLTRYGRIAATALIEALRLCGADCTRAGLMMSFDRVRLAAETDWPMLDYGALPLTGTDEVKIFQACPAGP